MTDNEIAIKLTEHDGQIKSCQDDITELKGSVRLMNQLVVSVERMTVTLENMVHTQEQTNDRLTALEKEPADKYKTIKNYAVTAILGLIIGFLFKTITGGN